MEEEYFKIFCKRTYFKNKQDFSPECLFIKNKIYKCRYPFDYEKIFDTVIIIESENNIWYHINKKNFIKYFKTIEDMRDRKIDIILK